MKFFILRAKLFSKLWGQVNCVSQIAIYFRYNFNSDWNCDENILNREKLQCRVINPRLSSYEQLLVEFINCNLSQNVTPSFVTAETAISLTKSKSNIFLLSCMYIHEECQDWNHLLTNLIFLKTNLINSLKNKKYCLLFDYMLFICMW